MEHYKSGVSLCQSSEGIFIEKLSKSSMSIVILGASGDLAKKKTYPALYGLHCYNLLPHDAQIIGYARSKLSQDELLERIKKPCLNVINDEGAFNSFFERCHYVAGDYNSDADFENLNKKLKELEHDHEANRLFYLALPPSVFSDAAHCINNSCRTKTGWNRVVVEKPFGHDLESSRKLVSSLGKVLEEKEQFRIDHYLGKEMVQNLLVIRFANLAFQPLWNRQAIACVVITFKEDFGVEGRGGYFNDIGIIRDVMQNHLLQVLSLVAMERPVSLSAEDIRDEKVKVLRCIPPVRLEDMVLGQYVADKAGKHKGYKDDSTVPQDSTCPTYAVAILHIENERWAGVPFILKCGKSLNERKAEVRIQFNDVPGQLFPGSPRNELVIKIQPNESTYLKMQVKAPGLAIGTEQAELELHYPTRYSDVRMPDAYERLLFDVLKGDHSQFVRADELDEAWKIFTPVLHEIEQKKVEPHPYEYGSRGPAAADKLIAKHHFKHFSGYTWVDPRSRV